MRKITFAIDRFDGRKSWTQSYQIDYSPGLTILACLFKIKEEQDPSLNFSASCRAAICGACGVRVNGAAALACDTRLDDMLKTWGGDELRLSPMGNFEIISDLMVNWDEKIERLRLARPGLRARPEFSEAEGCRQSPDDFAKIQRRWDCILCGACASECNKLSIDQSDFLEPFAYTHAARYALDSRSADGMLHVKAALDHGLWNCLHCMECMTKCPKQIAPVKDIAAMRAMAVKNGFKKGEGPRHALAFVKDVEQSGRLNEVRLPPRTEGLLKTGVKRLPFTIRMLRRGKISAGAALRLFVVDNKPIKGIAGLRKILRKQRSV